MKFKSFKILEICLITKIKFLARKFLYYFRLLNTYGKREGSGSASVPQVLMTIGSGYWRPSMLESRIRLAMNFPLDIPPPPTIQLCP
jgi:hypothetical protein